MAELQIKNHTRAARCEVCHQADMYDSASNHCWRCANIKIDINITIANKKISDLGVADIGLPAQADSISPFQKLIPLVTMIVGLIGCLIYIDDLSGMGLCGFLGFGLAIGLVIGIAIIAALIIINRIYQAAYPLSNAAMMARYQDWKMNPQKQEKMRAKQG